MSENWPCRSRSRITSWSSVIVDMDGAAGAASVDI
jgi:hypothetical protein